MLEYVNVNYKQADILPSQAVKRHGRIGASVCLANLCLCEPNCSLLSSAQTPCLWSNEKREKTNGRAEKVDTKHVSFCLRCVLFRLHMPLLLWRHGNRPRGPPRRGSFPSGWRPLTLLMTLNTWVTHTSVRSVSVHLAVRFSFCISSRWWTRTWRGVGLLTGSRYISMKPLVTDESN